MARPIFWLPLAALSLTPLQALDLTPHHTHRDLEGFRIPVVRFRHESQNITYQPPSGWRVTGTEKSLQLIPPNGDSAVVSLRLEPRAGQPASASPLNDGTGEGGESDTAPEPELPTRKTAASTPKPEEAGDFEKWARAYLPGTATQIERIGEVSNAFMIGNASSREVLFSYQLPTGRFVAGVAAVDWSEKERLAVVTIARREEFKRVHDDAIASLFSWQIGD